MWTINADNLYINAVFFKKNAAKKQEFAHSQTPVSIRKKSL